MTVNKFFKGSMVFNTALALSSTGKKLPGSSVGEVLRRDPGKNEGIAACEIKEDCNNKTHNKSVDVFIVGWGE